MVWGKDTLTSVLAQGVLSCMGCPVIRGVLGRPRRRRTMGLGDSINLLR